MKKTEIPPPDDMALFAELPAPFIRWFVSRARELPWRRDREPYHVWLSEIMLQQTRTEAVKGYYSRFLDALPDIRSLADASEETVLKLWEGLGYYRRALNLHRAALIVARDMGGAFPSTYEGILALPGIGAYTAGAIASICFGLPKPAVDGNVLRILARILDSDMSVDSPAYRRRIEAGLEAAMIDAARGFDPGDFNQSLMEAGATICLPKGRPKCGLCPARPFCRGCRSGRAELLPVRDVKKARRAEELTVFILWMTPRGADGSREDRLGLRRRGNEGLLAGMWELPNVPGRLSPEEALEQVRAWGLEPASLEKSLDRVHVFTHVEWRMRAYVIRVGPEYREGIVWTTAEEREQAYPLPAAFSLCL